MAERDIIARTPVPRTVESIYQDLVSLGVKLGDTLVAHSSLSSLGWVCGGPLAVVQALLQAVGEDGTLVMPAHSGDWGDPAEWANPPVPESWIPVLYEQMPAFDPALTPSRGMGRIAELFRTYPGTCRSRHPHVSFSAFGREARFITDNHPLTPQFGPDSPLAKIYRMNGRVLLLGVGYNSCTCFHLGEVGLTGMPVKKMGAAMLVEGRRVWQWFRDYDYDADDFDRLGQDFEKNNAVLSGSVGSADCRLFAIREAVDYAREWLGENRQR